MKGGGRAMEFEKIYSTYFNDVYRYIRKLSGNEHIAEEITSETFFKAMRSIDSFRGDCDFRVWLCQIAKNCYYSYLKKNKHSASIEDAQLEDVVDPNSFVDEKIANYEQTMQIQKLLHTLSEPYKEVFMWRVFADLSFKQIAQIFNKTDNWACVTYHRAKNQILKRMEEENNEKS